ncbi:hypothetical protein BGZ91_011334 [Linnemannia elongata]|nr:hypothetical protein BGZ91_011334 [Linnemannia elongata]
MGRVLVIHSRDAGHTNSKYFTTTVITSGFCLKNLTVDNWDVSNGRLGMVLRNVAGSLKELAIERMYNVEPMFLSSEEFMLDRLESLVWSSGVPGSRRLCHLRSTVTEIYDDLPKLSEPLVLTLNPWSFMKSCRPRNWRLSSDTAHPVDLNFVSYALRSRV